MPGKFTDSLIGENLKVATEYFKAMVADPKNKNSGGSIGFIPFKISFTMDGLSGIKIYNSLTVDTSFMPIGYSNTLRFIVTGVDHKLNQGDWETTLNTTLIPKTDTISKITGSLKFKVQKEAAVSPVNHVDPVNPVTKSNNKYGGNRGDFMAWVPGPNYPDPSNTNNFIGIDPLTNKPKPSFNPARRKMLLEFEQGIRPNGYVIEVYKDGLSSNNSNKGKLMSHANGSKFTENENTLYFKQVLTGLGAPLTTGNLLWMKNWRRAEGANCAYNGWNSKHKITVGTPSTNCTSVGVQSYKTWNDGVLATIKTLTNGNYPTVIKALRAGLVGWDDGLELAILVSKWDMGVVPAKWQ